MDKKEKIRLGIAVAVLALAVIIMAVVYHFYGPQTKIARPDEPSAVITTTLEDETEALDETTDETETETETETEEETDKDKETEKETKKEADKKPTEPATKAPVKPTTPATEAQTEKQLTELTIEVVFADGTKKTHKIKTDANNLGDALMANGIVKGDKTEFGLFIKEVDGVKADDSKQEWWCITKGGVMTPSGADTTPIANGDKFELTLKTGYDM